jgi:hypothetical protein
MNESFGSCRRPSPFILAPHIPQWIPYAAGERAPKVGATRKFARNNPRRQLACQCPICLILRGEGTLLLRAHGRQIDGQPGCRRSNRPCWPPLASPTPWLRNSFHSKQSLNGASNNARHLQEQAVPHFGGSAETQGPMPAPAANPPRFISG